MSLLLDSHTVLWWLIGSPKLSRTARAAIEAAQDSVHVSAVTFYELRLKERLGKIIGMPEDLAVACRAESFRTLPVTAEHASRAAELPLHHKDPWDRLLIAQAQAEELSLVSADRMFGEYGVRVVW